MKKSYCLILITCFFLTSLFMISCGFTEIEKEQKSGRSPFWKVEKEGKVSYLLGTFHVGISLYELPCSNTILEQLKKSDLVFVEVVSGSVAEHMAGDFLSPGGEDFKSLNTYSQQFLRQKGVSNNLNCVNLFFALRELCVAEGLGVSALDM